MTTRVARRAAISGLVQGVFFRESLRRRAALLCVCGWARNRPDGTVEVWAEGPPEGVEALIDFCRRGPRGAVVERVEVEDVEAAGCEGFEIRG